MKKQHLFSLFFLIIDLPLFAQNIYRTACQGKLPRLDSLLQETTINTEDDRGRSLLHWAIACKKKEVFDFLMDKGIAINIEDNEGATPLHMAIRFDQEIFVDALLDKQKNKHWVQRYGASLLEQAIIKKNVLVFEKLIVLGVDMEVTNDKGNTPLQIAQRLNATIISDWLIIHGAYQDADNTPDLKGDYLGQTVPGRTPKVFAPNFISTEESEFGSVFNADATEFYYGVDKNGKNEIRYSQRIDDQWSKPKAILIDERYGYNDPFLSPDEQRLYFISNRALDGQGEPKNDIDIWYVEKTGNGWSEPINAGPNINSEVDEYYISFTDDGTMYYSSNKKNPLAKGPVSFDIFTSKYEGGVFQKSVALPEAINTSAYEADVFVDPNEQYVIFCAIREEGLGRGDLYISFKNPDGSWAKSISMGATINTPHHELCPFVSKDGKYLFYTSKQDIYWVSAEIIEELRVKK